MSSNTRFPFEFVVSIIVTSPASGIWWFFILATFVNVNLNFAPSTFPPPTDEVFNNVNFSIIDLFSTFIGIFTVPDLLSLVTVPIVTFSSGPLVFSTFHTALFES